MHVRNSGCRPKPFLERNKPLYGPGVDVSKANPYTNCRI